MHLTVLDWAEGQRIVEFPAHVFSTAELMAVEFDIGAGGRPVTVEVMCPDPECHGGRDTTVDGAEACPTCEGAETVSRRATIVGVEKPEDCMFALWPGYSALTEDYPAKIDGKWYLPGQTKYLNAGLDLLAILSD